MATKTFKIGLSNTDKQNMAQDVYERVLALTFAEYDSANTYNEGDFVVYDDTLYQCKEDNVTGAWDSSKWEQATLQDLLDDVEGAVASVNDKANVDGNYPTLTVGLADNLNTKIVQNEKEAYLFRTTGGSLEVGNNCKEKAIVGGSIGFNQLAKELNSTNWSTNSASVSYDSSIATFTVSAQYGRLEQRGTPVSDGHVLLLMADVKLAANYALGIGFGNPGNFQSEGVFAFISSVDNDWHNYYKLGKYGQLSPNQNINFMDFHTSDFEEVQVKNVQLIDLTAMFGATIADYIYTLEQGEAGAGVAWFRRYFNKPYYPYTAIGGFIHVKTSGKKVVGFNQWDEQWELGNINWNTGANLTATNRIRSKNYIPALPDTVYCITRGSYDCDVFFYDANKNFIEPKYLSASTKTFTTPTNCAYMRFTPYGQYGTTYNHDICINFHYDGERDGEYEPYESETYANDNIELIGIPKIDAQGNLYYDGNVYNADGTVNKTLASKTYTGQETFLVQSAEYRVYRISVSGMKNTGQSSDIQNVKAWLAGYTKDTTHAIGEAQDDMSIMTYSGNIYIKDSSCADATAMAAKMANRELIYELATPTEDSATPYPENQPCNNWGTEERIDTRDIPVPVGHDTDYPLDLKSKLEILPNLPSDDGVYVCKVESGTGEYVALGSWLVANGYIKLTDISGYDAEKTQTLKNVEGTLTWVDDE